MLLASFRQCLRELIDYIALDPIGAGLLPAELIADGCLNEVKDAAGKIGRHMGAVVRREVRQCSAEQIPAGGDCGEQQGNAREFQMFEESWCDIHWRRGRARTANGLRARSARSG